MWPLQVVKKKPITHVIPRWRVMAIAPLIAVLGIIFLVGSFQPSAYANGCYATITVTNTANSGTGTLRSAVSDLCNGGTINFDGLPANSTIELTGAIGIVKSMTISGPGAELLTISGGGFAQIFNIYNGHHITINGVTLSEGTSYDGGGAIRNQGVLTITNSTLTANVLPDDVNGGALLNESNGTVFISNSLFAMNSTSGKGDGGALANDGTATIINSRFLANTSGDYAGAILNSGIMTLVNSEIAGNISAGEGGGIGNRNSGELTIEKSQIVRNQATWGSAGIDNRGVSLQLRESIVSDNITVSLDPVAAGIANYSGTLTILDSIVQKNRHSHNSINGYGGGIYNTATMLINRSFIAENVATKSGGAIWNAATLTISNTTFYSNVAGTLGGAIYLLNDVSINTYLYNNTFVGNQAELHGGNAIYKEIASNLEIFNNLFVTTTAASRTDAQCMGLGIGNMVNIGVDPSCHSMPVPPMMLGVGELGTYGGKVPVLPLLPTNFAINIANTLNVSCPADDARGIARPQPLGCDMGAFESTGFTLTLVSGDNQSTLINTPFAQPLVVEASNVYSEPIDGVELSFVGPLLAQAGITPTIQFATFVDRRAAITPMANSFTGVYSVTIGAYWPKNSVSFNLENTAIETSIEVGSTLNPSTFSEQIEFTATVNVIADGSIGAYGPSGYGGSVAFLRDGTLFDTVALDENNVAKTNVWLWNAGSYSITAVYLGHGDYLSSTSEALTQVVTKDSTSVGLASSQNPAEIEEYITLTAVVTPGIGLASVNGEMNGEIEIQMPNPLTGTVEFYDGTTLLGSDTLEPNREATLTINDLPAGDRQITAIFVGNHNYLGSTSNLYSQSIYKHSTETAIESSQSSIRVDGSFQLTVSVSSDYRDDSVGSQVYVNPLEGNVKFYENGVYLFEQAIDEHGQTVLWMGGLTPAGTYTYNASYQGNEKYLPSTSNVVTVVVNKVNSSVALVSDRATTLAGETVTFTATVESELMIHSLQDQVNVQARLNPLNGKVIFKQHGTTLGEVTLDEHGVARFATHALSVGNHTITAEYVGNEYLNGSTSANLSHTVNPQPQAPTAVNDAAGTLEGQAVSIAVLSNDVAGSNNNLTLQSVTQPTNGSVVINGSDVVYTPSAGFSGLDSFTYTVANGDSLSDSGLVAVIVSKQTAHGQAAQVAVINNSTGSHAQFTGSKANIEIDVPSGIYSGTLTNKDVLYLVLTWIITPTAGESGNLQFANLSFDLSAYLNGNKLENFVFAEPVTMTINYGTEVLGDLSPATVQLRFLDGNTWSTGGIEVVSHDTINRSFVVQISHLTEFALFASAPTDLEEVDQPGIQLFMPQVTR